MNRAVELVTGLEREGFRLGIWGRIASGYIPRSASKLWSVLKEWLSSLRKERTLLSTYAQGPLSRWPLRSGEKEPQ
jgi:hypothetical protein